MTFATSWTSGKSKGKSTVLTVTLLTFLFGFQTQASSGQAGLRFLQIQAHDRNERSAIANLGVSIEAVRSDSVWAIANENSIRRLKDAHFVILGDYDLRTARGGHEQSFDFPQDDSQFHNYQRTIDTLNQMHNDNSDITTLSSIGKTVENRDIYALHINTNPGDLKSGTSNKPGAIYMGNHHAREHVSLEIPLMWADYLLKNRKDPKIAALLDARDIWIIPMVNPDGAEFDISTGNYQYWRKNRRDNGDGNFGVDLNRNYGYEWGTGGSDKDTSSEVYMGSAPFSEPETIAIKNFVDSHLNAKVLLTFHTFSELILYPWGHTNDPISNPKDLQVFQTMANTMAQWNHYTPEQSSALYIASGDTTDWAYGVHNMFAFTFELSPKDMFDGGFYPGEAIIDKVFQDNLQPCLYMLDVADDPYKVLKNQPQGFLKNYVEPYIPMEYNFEIGTTGFSG